MNYTPEEIIEYVEEEDVKFIRLAFIDLKGNRKMFPSCQTNCVVPLNTALPLTPLPLMDSRM